MIYQLFYNFFKKNILILILYLLTLLYLPINKLGMPHVYGKLISKLKDARFDNSLYYFIILIILWFFIQGLKILSSLLRANLLPKFNSYVRNQLIFKIMNNYKTNYEDLEIGNTITKIIRTPWLLQEIFYNLEDFIFRNIIVIITSFIYLFLYNKNLSYIYLICMVSILIVCIIFTKSCSKYSKNRNAVYDQVHEEIEDTLSNMMSVYTSQKIDYEKKRIIKLGNTIFKNEKKEIYCNSKFKLIYTILFIIIFIVLNGYSYYIFKNKQIKLDTFISIIIINYSLLSSFMTLFYDTRAFITIKGQLDVFRDYLNNLPHSAKEHILKIKNPKNLKIVFENVNFYYSKNNHVLKNINLTINNNDIIGLIGGIGSGKSSLAKLLVRLKQYDSGKIYLSKYEINKINLDNLRSIINYIPQHPKLFNRTLFHNIVYGIKKDVNESQIINILDKLKMKNTTEVFKKNMYKNVGKNGSNLSGGQRQIVWLIRAILKDSKVIILDEPTSSLDNKSKIQVIEFIKNFCKNRILILITHDEELLKYVNKIVKLDKGRIVSVTKK